MSVELREAAEAVATSAAALAALAGVGVDVEDQPGADRLRDVADACLDGFAEVGRLEARAAAVKVRLAAEYAAAAAALVAPAASPQECTAREMAVVAEVACVLTVSERSASALLSDAQVLTTALPLTLGALQAGAISWQHARIMADETAGLDAAGAAALEAHFLDPDVPDPARGCPVGELVPGRFRAKARVWRERHHPVSIEKRHKKCAADRRVEFVPDRDGMAWLNAYLPADTAAGIWERTTAGARALQGPGESRTLTQLRADVAAGLLLSSGLADSVTVTPAGGTRTPAGEGLAGAVDGASAGGMAGPGICGGVPVPRAQVLVTVPVMSLLGLTDEPAMLDGYGPIPPSMARRLIADGADSFHRVLIDPRDGAPLEIGRTSYRIPRSLRQWLRLRDGKCPFPGCNNPSLDNEADHLLAWAGGGTTGISNLGQPCRKHHRLKHTSAWTPTGASKDHPPGWISPSGRHYPSERQDWEPPLWPGHILRIDDGPNRSIPPDPGPLKDEGPEPDLPPDPFPDWHEFIARHEWPVAEMDDQGWLVPLDQSFPEDLPWQLVCTVGAEA